MSEVDGVLSFLAGWQAVTARETAINSVYSDFFTAKSPSERFVGICGINARSLCKASVGAVASGTV
jgi:hypothetical protein